MQVNNAHPESSSHAESVAPRKRRKRAPAAGAANDCFTCLNTHIQCDRQRPYCSRCLNAGRDCAGYKTELTWGVGVASRGKLRGLSLPVASVQNLTQQVTVKRKRNAAKMVSTSPGIEANTVPMETPPKPAIPSTLPDLQAYQAGLAADTFTVPISHPSVSYPLSAYSSSPQYTSSLAPILPDHHHYQVFPLPDEPLMRHSTLDPSSPDKYSQRFSPRDKQVKTHSGFCDAEDIENTGIPYYEKKCAVSGDLHSELSMSTLDQRLILSPLGNASAIGKTSRMQYLISYYTEVISPVIVAFDGPNNPFRTQILRLAAGSETLQHAISALSASNLRQRLQSGGMSTCKTDPARRSSVAHQSLTDGSWHHMGLMSPQEQAREEMFHKCWAISTLNKQLAHPVLRKQDSILATLLILCLFHICDSGVAKFQTQFAGVKKLLSLRGVDLGIKTPETKWFTRMFTWFDAMTATVNDREGQLQGQYLELSALSDEEWALENLAGCDGQLFKIVARLGRLNVLSQGKSVEVSPMIVSSPLPDAPTRMDRDNFDGNERKRIMQDEITFCQKTAEMNAHIQFWREWREIRHALQTWQLNQNLYDPDNIDSPSLTPEQRIDLGNISESFRYSALLYTERIANPLAASNDANIQQWVRRSLMHIRLVRGDAYLLWPLFITGSECVLEEDRIIIRERCLDIQKDSGFLNNKSCFELIEKVWLANPGGHAVNMNGELLDGFRFSEIMRMENNEGEYIVV